ncbi:hypothetical protein [Zhihengliuella flava]|uniref:Uncharacterized protein n=1 Tax=Zhihengliuella flava TaxID=1285193 RepID=A0A931GGI2_9MICC|nr:hypothetical protein [Zhihengliuella flava]MBG6085832.1 hypothetical protein [Zhihengliuella flava]
MTENTKHANTDSITIDATLTSEAGVQVPLAVEIRWPEDHGVYALRFLNALPEYLESTAQALFQQLVQSGDASVVAAAARMSSEAGDDAD